MNLSVKDNKLPKPFHQARLQRKDGNARDELQTDGSSDDGTLAAEMRKRSKIRSVHTLKPQAKIDSLSKKTKPVLIKSPKEKEHIKLPKIEIDRRLKRSNLKLPIIEEALSPLDILSEQKKMHENYSQVIHAIKNVQENIGNLNKLLGAVRENFDSANRNSGIIDIIRAARATNKSDIYEDLCSKELDKKLNEFSQIYKECIKERDEFEIKARKKLEELDKLLPMQKSTQAFLDFLKGKKRDRRAIVKPEPAKDLQSIFRPYVKPMLRPQVAKTNLLVNSNTSTKLDPLPKPGPSVRPDALAELNSCIRAGPSNRLDPLPPNVLSRSRSLSSARPGPSHRRDPSCPGSSSRPDRLVESQPAASNRHDLSPRSNKKPEKYTSSSYSRAQQKRLDDLLTGFDDSELADPKFCTLNWESPFKPTIDERSTLQKIEEKLRLLRHEPSANADLAINHTMKEFFDTTEDENRDWMLLAKRGKEYFKTIDEEIRSLHKQEKMAAKRKSKFRNNTK